MLQVRALFRVARCFPSSVVFVDEIDSLLTARTDGEQEGTRRVTSIHHYLQHTLSDVTAI